MSKFEEGCISTILFLIYIPLIIAITVSFPIETIVSLSKIAYSKGILFTIVIPVTFVFIIVITTLLVTLSFRYKNKVKRHKKEIDEIIEIYNRKTKELEYDYNKKTTELNDNYKSKLNDLLKREGIIKHVLDSKTPFKYVAQMAADLSTYLYEKDENYLRYKPHPAISAAEKLKEIKETTNKELVFYKEIEYKYNFIIGSFPELKLYIDNDTELLSMAEYLSYSDLQENRDRSRDFLSNDEWNKLTVSQRNQLALDRYIQKRKKSNWAIGRDYEMACAYSLREKGFSVEMHGIEKRYGDLGRDLIATKFGHTLFDEDSKKGEIFIIQCKCWNKDLHITENVLMQLFGTTIAYQIENKKNFGNGIKIIPVLMVPPFTKLSDMAKNFAEILGIKIMIQEFIDFPRIKCNINGNDKIYHLPFDQQYDTAQIKNKGEFYAYTVAEAEEKGFRRAHRYKGNKNN